MFPALLYYRSLAPVRVKTEASFTAEDPWNRNRRTAFNIEAYMRTLKNLKDLPPRPRNSFGYLYGICSEVDGVERMLPASLSELWRSNRVPAEAIPRLPKQIDPTLKKSDYRPVAGKKTLSVLAGFLWVVLGLLTLMPLWLFSDGAISLSAAGFSSLVIAGISWLYMYLFVYRLKWRRTRQMEWILARH